MQDIADRVGVSKALVSMVFRNVAGPSEATRNRVTEIADELGYRPNRAAALLSLRRTRLIGVMAEIRNSFHTELVDFLVDDAERAGYDVVLGPVTATRTQAQAVDMLLEFQCEALVLLGPQLDAATLRAIDERAPVVSVGRRLPGTTIDAIRTADGRGVGMIVDHLVALGHTDIVHASGSGAIGADRASGYTRAMNRHGLEPQIVVSGFTEMAGAATAALLDRDELPSAVVCVNDRCAIGLLDAIQKDGIDVPGDMSITGYDDSQLAQLTHIALTSVSQDPREQARRAVAAVLERLDDGRTEPVSVVLLPRLSLRSTTGPAPHRSRTRRRRARSR
ncbi:LacI family DNA-binding transcriptional regulator [Rhodococcus koreensis]